MVEENRSRPIALRLRFGLSVAAFVVCYAGFWLQVQAAQPEPQKPPDLRMYRAKRPLAAGSILQEEDLESFLGYPELADADAFQDRAFLSGVLAHPVPEGAVLLKRDLKQKAERPRLADYVEERKRLYSLNLATPELAAEYWHNDLVDVFVEKGESISLVVDSVRVVQPFEASNRRARSVLNLAVDVSQWERLLKAESRGRLHVALRNPADDQKLERRVAQRKAVAKKQRRIEHVR